MNNRFQEKLIEISRALKLEKQGMREFHVCFITRKNKLIAVGCNSTKTHRLALDFKYPFAEKGTHAECQAIIRGKKKSYRGHEAYILRINNNNQADFSAPCSACSILLKRMKFNKIYFTNKSGSFVCQKN